MAPSAPGPLRISCLLAMVALLAVPAAHAMDWSDSDPAHVQVFLITAGPGHNEGAAWYGHSGFLVEDQARGEARYYHYRLDIPDGPLRPFETILGQASFHLFEWQPQDMYRFYGDQGRSIRATPLLLPPEDAAGIAIVFQEEARHADWIVYHAITDNCATRIRDHMDAAVGGALRDATGDVFGPTMREHVRPYLAHAPATHAMAWFAMSDRGDRPVSQWDALMLPLELEAAVQALQVETPHGPRPVAGPTVILLAARDPLQPPANPLLVLIAPALATLLTLLLLAGAMASGTQAGRPVAWAALGLGLVLALPAVAMTLFWSGVVNGFAAGNENLLLLSPLVWLLPIAAMRALRGRGWGLLQGTSTGLAVLAGLALVAKALPQYGQENLVAIAIFLPLYTGLAVAVRIADPERHPARAGASGQPTE